MSVLKNLDIDLPQSEKKTLYRFLSLYVFFTIVILGLTVSLYYTMQKELAISQRTIVLDEYANDFLIALEEFHNDKTDTLLYQIDKKFKTSLYGKDYKLIYSTLSDPKNLLTEVTYTNNKIIRYVTKPQMYYLNTQYIIVEITDDKGWLNETIKTIIIYSSMFFIIMMLIGYFLLNLFLKPMRDALHLLDTFIKDTTHELNTPVSTIVANIEMIDKSTLDEKLLKKINRIDIGAKTISNIYQDLTYLTLGNQIISNNEDVNIEQLITERVEYFKSLAGAKKVTLESNIIQNTFLHIDKSKISKLLDNLISNAIKYNKVGGSIIVSVDENKFEVEDSGIGIAKEDISQMQERYTRFNKSSGGFGIGLNIVSGICKEYDLNIDIESEEKIGTKVRISW